MYKGCYVGKGKNLNKVTLLTLLLILALSGIPIICQQQKGKWFYWIRPGVYVTLMQSDKGLEGIRGFLEGMMRFNSLRYPNGTLIGFKNISLTWRVLEVHEDKALVNYTIVLFDAYYAEEYMGSLKPLSPIGDVVLLSVNVLVKLDTLDVYSENGTYIGRWPFWIHGHEIGSKVIMVHDVLTFDMVAYIKNGSTIITHLDSIVNIADMSDVLLHFGKNPSSMGINTTLGFFNASRLLRCFPVVVPVDNKYISAGPHFPAFYDKVSLIMIAYCGGRYIDDIIRYVVGDILYGISLKKPLVITDSNIDFKFGEKPSSPSPSSSPPVSKPSPPVSKETSRAKPHDLLLRVAIVIFVIIVVVGGILYVWKRRHG
ncbi:MAG: hypothetical protein DRZ82_03325 [Thermoprotei archaeon]|nr:MAG: hypothetical protein DRZ82_03325 [Thermoprotei archaeon]